MRQPDEGDLQLLERLVTLVEGFDLHIPYQTGEAGEKGVCDRHWVYVNKSRAIRTLKQLIENHRDGRL